VRDLAYALATPLLGNTELEGELVAALQQRDQDARLKRCEEREWLAAGALFAICHEGIKSRMGWRPVTEVLVGGVAGEMNHELEFRGDSRRFSARSVGAALDVLGIRTEKLGRLGRGIELSPSVRGEIHRLARDYGITRRDLLSDGHKAEYGGLTCHLCVEYGVTGGLKFVEPPNEKVRPPSKRRLFIEVEPDGTEPAPVVSEVGTADNAPSEDSNCHSFKEISTAE